MFLNSTKETAEVRVHRADCTQMIIALLENALCWICSLEVWFKGWGMQQTISEKQSYLIVCS